MVTMTFGQLPDRDAFIHKTQGQFPYPMTLVGEDAECCIKAINQGIDAHLEAVFVDDVERTSRGLRLSVRDAGSMHTLIRRLSEQEDEEADSLASAIMGTLDYEWV